jgi:sortase A
VSCPVRRVLNVVGRILVGLGVLLLAFTAFQLWGTGLFEAHSQSVLRTQIDRQLPPAARAASASTTHRASAVPTGPPVTAPSRPAPMEGQPVGVIQIPAIALDQVVVQGVATADLRMGPGHYTGTPLPGQSGNAAIAGHRTTYGHPFYNLNQLAPGDQVLMTTPQGVFDYSVRTVSVVSPDDVSVLTPSASALLTLTTCNPRYSASQRLVVQAVLAHSRLFTTAGRAPTPPPTRPSGRHAPHAVAAAGLAGGGSDDWLPAVLWGLLVAAGAVATWWLARRRGRWWVYLVAAPVLALLLFVFFASLSPLLPATF